MKIVELKNQIAFKLENNKTVKLKPKNLYLFSDSVWASFRAKLISDIANSIKTPNMQNLDNINIFNKIKASDNDKIKTIYKKFIKEEINLDDVINRLDSTHIDEQSVMFPIILRSGGIGDLIAMSSISMGIVDMLDIESRNLIFISQQKYEPIFKWYKKPINFVGYFSSIAKYESSMTIDKNKVYRKFKTIFYEGVIENSKKNWYEVFFDAIGENKFKEFYGRPQLRTDRISVKKSNIDTSKKSILVNPRSTAIIRSMRFQDIYESIIECIGNEDINIYVHKQNIRKADYEYINFVKDERVKIISAGSLDDFFLDIYDATLCISVDTSMFHFREGIEKPAIGIYGPFTSDCRTKYYKFTKSIDIKSECPNMPCFIHVKGHDSICNFQQSLHDNNLYPIEYRDFAPCCCASFNKTLKQQIINGCKDFLLDAVK